MMRISIAGTNGFAQYLCHYLQEQTPHQFMLLSRKPNPGLAAKGWQVVPTTYDNFDELVYLLTGVDIVISTVAGPAQIALIDAAAAAHVKTFVPSEFRGQPSKRRPNDPTDDGRAAALAKLMQLQSQNQMDFTVFSCGIFYERFAPAGLEASQITLHNSLGGEGDFVADVRRCRATLPLVVDASPSQPKRIEEPYLCMTSSRDAARFVVAALDLQYWPKEFRFRAERLSLRQIIALCEKIRGIPFQIEQQTIPGLHGIVAHAQASGNKAVAVSAAQRLAAFEGGFDFADLNLDGYVHVECERFEDWLRESWGPVIASPATTVGGPGPGRVPLGP